jgi:hypothetical protein
MKLSILVESLFFEMYRKSARHVVIILKYIAIYLQKLSVSDG